MTPAVLCRYPSAVADLDWQALGTAGGFSGAAVWRGDTASQPALCLKCWPPGTTAQRLEAVHRAMTAAHSTGLVPALIPSLTGRTAVEHDGRIWDVTAWVTGAADFHKDPSDARLTAACVALADLHRAWAPAHQRLTPCPGVRRRLALLNDFTSKLPHLASDPYWDRPLSLLRPLVPRSIAELTPWVDRPVPVHPCLCDIWHDHVFYIGDRVSGIIDYGAMKVDHPAVDLARLLGDLVDGRSDRVRTGLAAYRAAAAPVPVDDELVTLLDRTGLICAVIHWHQRLGGTRPGNLQVLGRITRLVARLSAV